jgi:tetratricopeptide (TPR) repeat protein
MIKTNAMKKVRIILGIITLSIASSSLWGQMGKTDGSRFGHGEDSVRCITNLSLYREYARNKDYVMAEGYWKIVFEECPKASKNIYLDGVKIYKSNLSKKVEPSRKGELVDTLMLIYDKRIDNYGEKGKVRGRQGADLLKYRRNDDIKYVEQGYGYLKESVELMGDKTSKAVLPTLLSASITLYKAEVFEANQVIEDYLLVSNIVDAQIAKKPSDKRLQDLKAALDANFVKEGPGDCETLVAFFAEEHKTKSQDPEFLGMLTSLLKARDCTDDELFFIASKDLHTLSPSAESATNIALLAQKKGRQQEAIDFYLQAIDMEEDEVKKADYYFSAAVAYSKLKQYQNARENALKAASLKSGFGEPYILIGQMYAESKDLCTNSDSKNLPAAVFWVAVDKFNKAKSVDPELAERAGNLISTYSKYFPNKEEAFFKGVNEGDSYTVKGCWINETTKARFR